MALSFRLLFSLFIFNNIALLMVTSVNLRFKYSASYWRNCDTEIDAFLMFRGIPIQKCIFECRVRGRCDAAKFLTTRQECGLLETAVYMATEYNTKPCVFIRMADVQDNISIADICKNCSPNEVCNIRNKTCDIKECERLTVPHTHVLGNIQNVGAKVKLVPHTGYTLHQYNGTTRCNSSAEWDHVPAIVETCVSPWIKFEESCYFEYITRLNFTDAMQFCSTMDAHLIHIETKAEDELIVAHFGRLIWWWIGITKANTHGKWKFVHTNASVTYSNWSGNYTTSDEQCAVAWYGPGWIVISCNVQSNVICEK